MDSLIEHPKISGRPRLYRALKVSKLFFTSAPIAAVFALAALSLGASNYFDSNLPIIVWSSIVIILSIFGVVSFLIAFKAMDFSYNVDSSTVHWMFQDAAGNNGNFKLRQTITLNKTADFFYTYTALNEFIDLFIPFSEFNAIYEGQRKKLLGILRGPRPASDSFDIEIDGRHRFQRVKGLHCIEVPIDFPTDDLEILIEFNQISRSTTVTPHYIVRWAGETWPASKSDINGKTNARRVGEGFRIRWTLDNPRYGHSYIIKWESGD